LTRLDRTSGVSSALAAWLASDPRERDFVERLTADARDAGERAVNATMSMSIHAFVTWMLFPSDTNSDLLWISNSGAVNIWVVNGANVQVIPVSAPTGSTLGLNSAAQSQAQPVIHAAPAAGPLAPQPPTPPLILASTPTTPTLIGASTGQDSQTHTLV
jgi:hypothetical protein